MDVIYYGGMETKKLPGRTKKAAVGMGAKVASEAMNICICRYSQESGPMEPHHHPEETVYVISSDRAYVRCGGAKNALSERMPLAAGMMMHFPADEWHVFEYDEGGYLELLCIYGAEC